MERYTTPEDHVSILVQISFVVFYGRIRCMALEKTYLRYMALFFFNLALWP